MNPLTLGGYIVYKVICLKSMLKCPKHCVFTKHSIVRLLNGARRRRKFFMFLDMKLTIFKGFSKEFEQKTPKNPLAAGLL